MPLLKPSLLRLSHSKIHRIILAIDFLQDRFFKHRNIIFKGSIIRHFRRLSIIIGNALPFKKICHLILLQHFSIGVRHHILMRAHLRRLTQILDQFLGGFESVHQLLEVLFQTSFIVLGLFVGFVALDFELLLERSWKVFLLWLNSLLDLQERKIIGYSSSYTMNSRNSCGSCGIGHLKVQLFIVIFCLYFEVIQSISNFINFITEKFSPLD